MHARVGAIVIALTALLFASSCTPEEVAFYLSVTDHVNDVLSADELKRLRDCESTDNYAAVSLWTDTVGLYRGAYQFVQHTWDGVAERHFPWLVGQDPVEVEPWWQDAMARALWSERGRQPWPICGLQV